MCRKPVKNLTIEVEHDPLLDDVWQPITDALREMVREGDIRLSDRIRISSIVTFRNEHGNVLRILDLS